MHLSLRIGALALALISLIVTTYLFGPFVPFLALAAALIFGIVHMATRTKLQPWMLAGLPALIVVLFLPAVALAATIEIGQALTGSLQDIINGAVAAAITALLGWLMMVAKTKFNIDIEAKHRDALKAFLQRQGAGLVAAGAVKLNGLKVDVQSQALADAANAALAAIPGALKFFGLTTARIEGMIVDLLPNQPAVAQAQAIALDVANPATPSTPAA